MNLKLSAHQPYFFPYLPYFQLINNADIFVLLDDVSLSNKKYVTSNTIKTNNQNTRINLHIQKKKQSKKIINCKILFDDHQRKKFFKSLENYRKISPHYHDVLKIITDIFEFINRNDNLADFLHYKIQKINSYLGIKTEIIRSSNIFIEGKNSERLINLCKKYNCNTYINSIDGINLYNKKIFLEKKINLNFLKSSDEVLHDKSYGKHSILNFLFLVEKKNFKKLLNSFSYL
jgi:hypothetical protein